MVSGVVVGAEPAADQVRRRLGLGLHPLPVLPVAGEVVDVSVQDVRELVRHRLHLLRLGQARVARTVLLAGCDPLGLGHDVGTRRRDMAQPNILTALFHPWTRGTERTTPHHP